MDVKRNLKIARTSVMDMVDFMMAQTGLNRQQAIIAFDTIVHYMRQNPGEPLHRVVKSLFGHDNEDKGPVKFLN